MNSANLKRKAASIALLKERGVSTIDHLPPLDPDEDLELHTPEEVFRRMRANFVYFMRGQFAMENAPLAEFRKSLDKLQAWDDLSPAERAVVESAKLTQQQIVETSWAVEAVHALQWAVNLTSDLEWPVQACNLEQVFVLIKGTKSPEGLELRALSELLEQMDLHYRLLWACRESMLKGKEPPADVNASVVLERMRALGWLVHRGIGWDEADLSS